MKQHAVKVLSLWLALVAEQLLLFPLAILLYQLTGVARFGVFMVSYLLLHGLAMLLRVLLPRRLRPWLLLAGMLAGVALCLLFSPSLIFQIIGPILLAINLWHGVRMTENENPGSFFSSFLLLGFLLYPLVAFVFSRSTRFAGLVPLLGYTGTAGILLALILINRQQIRDAGTVLERRLHLPSSLMKRNSVYLAVFAFLVVAGAAWEFFGRMVAGLFSLVGRIIGAIIAFLGSLYQPEEPVPDAGPGEAAAPDMLPPPEPTPRWLEILEQILIVLVAVALGALLLWGMYRILRKLMPVLKKAAVFLTKWLRKVFLGDDRQMGEDPGYVDEVESLLKQNETTWTAAQRWLMERLAHEPAYGRLKTDKERIRWLYRNALRRELRHGQVFEPGDTPAEILRSMQQNRRKNQRLDAETAASLYGQVRYGDRDPLPEDVERMKGAL